ncbi:MAG: hypothetical protein ACE5IJ_04255 [Thermoplasmata archaeon]
MDRMTKQSLAIVLTVIAALVAVIVVVAVLMSTGCLPRFPTGCPQTTTPSIAIQEAEALFVEELDIPRSWGVGYQYTVRFCDGTGQWWGSGRAPAVPDGAESGQFREFPDSRVPADVRALALDTCTDDSFRFIFAWQGGGSLAVAWGWVHGTSGIVVGVGSAV